MSLVLVVGVLGGGSALAASDRDGDGLRDSFETRWGLTSPRDRDSDGDGVLDPAEDHDGDGLSDLGEQRFRTSPRRADTDRDGISDWAEDSNRNGTPDGREQDRRAVPARLRPSLAGATDDTPLVGRNGCHSRGRDVEVHPCTFGARRGSVRIALFGDSHAVAWLAAFDRAGAARGWRVTSITKSACPSAHVRFVHAIDPDQSRRCARWREDAEQWLRDHPQALVVITNHRGYDLVDEAGTSLVGPQADDAWRQGIEDVIAAVGGRVLVLGDLPTPGRDVPACLRAHRANLARCTRSRAASTDEDHAAAERAAAVAGGATYRSPAAIVCPYDPCPVIVADTLIWRDKHHLTATYSRRLAPTIRRFIQAAMRD